MVFGEPDEKEKSSGYPDEYIWYGSILGRFEFTIHNQALRKRPSPQQNREWTIHCGLTQITMKLLKFIIGEGVDKHEIIKMIFDLKVPK